MFGNIGGKIKAWAKVLCWIGIIVFVIAGIITMVNGNSMYGMYGYSRSGMSAESFFAGLLIAVIGALASWVGSFVLYGFGELIDTNAAIADKLSRMQDSSPQQQSASGFIAPPVQSTPPTWRCQKCGTRNANDKQFCQNCDEKR